MKLFTRLFIAAACLMASALAQASLIYQYSYTFGNGAVVTGSFTGTANGNLITDLSDISASINGMEFMGSGALFGAHFDGLEWISGGAIASFDGTQNNFIFVDVNFPFAGDLSNYFISYGDTPGGPTNGAAVYANLMAGWHYSSDMPMDPSNYSASRWWISPNGTTVPEPTTLLLMGLGLVGLGLVRRRQAKAKKK